MGLTNVFNRQGRGIPVADPSYTIRNMTRAELDVAVEWAAQEGWNPGLGDAECFYRADPGGYLMGFLGEEPVASISAVRYGDSFGFVGFYIVKEEQRGKGFGLQIWNAAMSSLGERVVGLDGVVAQQENYRKSGFVLAYRNVRYQGQSGGDAPADPEIVHLANLPFADILAYDGPFFPAGRTPFLEGWIRQPQSVALGLRSGGRLAGYGVIRPCRSGYKIGPLFADSPEAAERLFRALGARVRPGEPLYLDVPEPNEAAVALAEQRGMERVFETARMYRGAPPKLPIERLFGVTTFELG